MFFFVQGCTAQTCNIYSTGVCLYIYLFIGINVVCVAFTHHQHLSEGSEMFDWAALIPLESDLGAVDSVLDLRGCVQFSAWEKYILDIIRSLVPRKATVNQRVV